MKEQKNTKKVQKHNTRRIKGITLIALVVTIVVLLILASVSITVVFGDNGILQLAKEAGEKTNEAVKNDQDQISDAEGIINEYLTELNSPIKSSIANEEITFATNYGTIDVIWLDTNNRVKAVPNEPILSAKNDSGIEETMTKVKWTEKQTVGSDNVKWEENEESKEKPWSNAEWYNYQKAEGTDDTKKSRWANAKTANGSYFVWIPRYAYRITYYASEEKIEEQEPTGYYESEENIEEQEPTGYYDGWGMYDKEGNLKYKLDEGIETVAYNGNKYIVHPAFMDNTENNFDNGGWDKDLAGFWFAKYEMSENSKEIDDNSNKLKSVPDESALGKDGRISIGEMYKMGRDATYGYTGKTEAIQSGNETYTHTSYMNSHMIKNSEWGAVAYLAHSSYGRNGHEIDVNNSSDYITGKGGGDVSGKVGPTGGISNSYNTEIGAHASTTGNIYGIYDMSGGIAERSAVYDKLGNSVYLLDDDIGLKMTQESKNNNGEYISKKYVTSYSNETETYNGDEKIYSLGKTGDIIKEVHVMNKLEAWFGDSNVVVSRNYPFETLGGYCGSTENYAGIFYTGTSLGNMDFNAGEGLRTVLCP